MKKRVRTKAEDKFRHEVVLEKQKEKEKKKSKKKPSKQKVKKIKESSSVESVAATVALNSANEGVLLTTEKSSIESSQISNGWTTEEVIEESEEVVDESVIQERSSGTTLSQNDILTQLQSSGASFPNQTTENNLQASLNILNESNTASAGLVGELLKQYLENQKKAIEGLMAQLMQQNLVQRSSELVGQIAAQSAVPNLNSLAQLLQQSQAQGSSDLTSQITAQPAGLDLNSLINVQNTHIASPNLINLLRLNSHESTTSQQQEPTSSKNLTTITFDIQTAERLTAPDSQTVNDSKKEEHSPENGYIVQDNDVAMDSFDIREQPNEKDCNMNYDDEDDDGHDLLAIVRPRSPAPDLSNVPDDNEFVENLTKDNKTKQELDLYKQDSDGDTYLHIGVIKGHPAIAMLIDQMKHESLDVQNKLGQTPLHLAVLSGKQEIIERLVVSGASVSVMDYNGDTPLHLACRTGNRDLVFYALNGGLMKRSVGRDAALETRNFNGETPLHIAVTKTIQTQAVDFAMLAVLLNSNGDINITDGKTGKTCLYLALEANNFKLAEYLIGRGADVNTEAYSGSSPLHLACRSGNISMVRRLLEKEASLYSKNVDSESVKDVATSNEIKQVLEKAMKKERRKRQKVKEEREAKQTKKRYRR